MAIKYNDALQGTLEECARMRGCYPLINRIESQFFEWLMVNRRNCLSPFAEEFYNHCVELYNKDTINGESI